MPYARFVTDFGDQAVLLPLAVCVAVVFASNGWRRGAFAWTAAVGGTFGLMLALKLSFLACGHLLPVAGLQSPSGHTAAAAAVYGGLLALAARRLTGSERWALPCAMFVAFVIGTSRVALGVHTGLEVVIGGSVGVCGALAAAMLAGAPPPTLKIGRVVAVSLTVLLLFHGFRMPAEAAIRTMAADLWPLSYCR